MTEGGRDHTSHRLVYYGLSEGKAVALLAMIALALGATSIAYNVLDNERLTMVGVLLTFVLLVQFGGFLSDVGRAHAPRPAGRHVVSACAHVRAQTPRRGARRFRAHLRVVPRGVPAGRRRQGLRAAAWHLPRRAARRARRPLRLLHRVPHLPAGVAVRDVARRARDRRCGRGLRAGRLRHRRGDTIARAVPGSCLPGRRGAVHRTGRLPPGSA